MSLFSAWQDKTPLRPGGNHYTLENSAKQTLLMRKILWKFTPIEKLIWALTATGKNKEIEIPHQIKV